jgi:activator of HSP90 ATPase
MTIDASGIIRQTIPFEGVTDQDLYDTYTDERLHGAAIGAPARIVRRPGGVFSMFGDLHVRGRTLLLDSPRIIVQEWQAGIWKPGDPMSLLVLQFSATETGAQIDLVQVGVPAHAVKMIDAGWQQRYWDPWRAYFAGKAGKQRVHPTGSPGVIV